MRSSRKHSRRRTFRKGGRPTTYAEMFEEEDSRNVNSGESLAEVMTAPHQPGFLWPGKTRKSGRTPHRRRSRRSKTAV